MAALGQPQFDALVRDEAEVADLDTTRYVHTNRYVDELEAARPSEGYVYLDGGDTMMEPSTWEVVLRGVGATVQAVGKVLDGEVQNAFVACRPPGHHAGIEQAMGFCLFNNISIGARYAQEKHGLGRVAIVDFDVHHGNGTQEIFYSDASVLYASTHQMPLFPGTGAESETGVGNIFNARLAPGDGGAELRKAFANKILPALNTFAAGAHHRLRRVRRSRTRSARFVAHDGRRFRLGDTPTDEIGGDALPRPTRLGPRRRLRPSGPCGFGQCPCRRAAEGLTA